MKTSVIEVEDMLSVLSVAGVEERIGKVPGVESVTVNHAAKNATVRYDETRLDVVDIKSAVHQAAYATETAPAPKHASEHADTAPASGDKPDKVAPPDKVVPKAAMASPSAPGPSIPAKPEVAAKSGAPTPPPATSPPAAPKPDADK